jgi:pimeloyl-ACP methyl ester carboxylesterase
MNQNKSNNVSRGDAEARGGMTRSEANTGTTMVCGGFSTSSKPRRTGRREHALSRVGFGDEQPTVLPLPVVILQGRHDLHTPWDAAKEYFDSITSPSKIFVTFERSAHFPMFEEPGRFLLTLVTEVRPLAGPPVSFSREP